MSEFEPATASQFEAIDYFSKELLDKFGTKATEGRYQSATVSLGESALVGSAEENVSSTIKVTAPIDPRDVKWKYVITYDLQDGNMPRTILVEEDDIIGDYAIETSYVAEVPEDMLSKEDAGKIVDDFIVSTRVDSRNNA